MFCYIIIIFIIGINECRTNIDVYLNCVSRNTVRQVGTYHGKSGKTMDIQKQIKKEWKHNALRVLG